jgi:hypothetical protein
MTPKPYSEDHLVEQPALALLEELGWQTACGLEETFAPEGQGPLEVCLSRYRHRVASALFLRQTRQHRFDNPA